MTLAGAFCGSCALRAERKIEALAGVRSARIDAVLETADIAFDPSRIRSAEIIAALEKLGLDPRVCRVFLPLGADAFGRTNTLQLRRRLAGLPGVTRCSIDSVEGIAVADFLPGSVDVDSMREELRALGHPPAHPVPQGCVERERRTNLLPALAAAAGSLLNILLFLRSLPDTWPWMPLQEWLRRILPSATSFSIAVAMLLIGVLTMAVAGRRLVVHGWRSVRSRSLTADALQVAAAVLALAAGGAGALSGLPLLDLLVASPVALAMHLFAKAAAASAMRRAGANGSALDANRARTANVVSESGAGEVELEQLRSGSRVVVESGVVPVDGRVAAGSATVDGSHIGCGKKEAAAGSEIAAGSIVSSGRLEIEASAGPRFSLAATIRRLLRAGGERTREEVRSEAWARAVPPIALAASVAALAGWVYATGQWTTGVAAFLALLVAFPLGAIHFVAPLAFRVARDAAAGKGIVFQSARTVETAASLTTLVLLDSAVTQPRVSVTEFVLLGGVTQRELLRVASGVLFHSSSPLARAVVARALRAGIVPPTVEPTRAEVFGAAGTLDGVPVMAGQASWLERQGAALELVAEDLGRFAGEGKSPLAVVVGGKVYGVIVVERPVIEGVAAAVESLSGLGVRTFLATSDAESTARVRASQLGVKDAQGELSETDQVRLVSSLRQKGGTVGVASSGRGDRRAASRADLAISFATPLEACFSEVTIVAGDRSRIGEMVALSRAARRRAARNFLICAVYGIATAAVCAGALVPLTGLAPSLMAAAAGALGATVVVNWLALRLRAEVR